MSETSRLKGLFFWYFAYVGILSPYLSLYLNHLGYSVTQIGVLLSIPQLMRIVSPGFWGWLADRRSRSGLLRISSVLALLAVLGLPAGAAYGIVVLSLVMALLSFAAGAQVPIGEALTLRVTGGQAGGYGRIRLWGSVGFILGVVGVGAALDRTGLASLPAWLALALMGLIGSVWSIQAEAVEPAVERRGSMLARLRQPAVIAFFVANALMIFAHAALYVLYSLWLAKLGFGETAIGLLWALGVVAEIVLFRFQQAIFDRYPAISLIVFSLLVAALRFALVGMVGGTLWLLIVLQLSHAITFGLHHSAVMRVLHEWFEPPEQARAQAAYITISYGLGGTAGGLALTAIWEVASPAAAFYSAAAAAVLGAAIMYWGQGASPPRTESDGPGVA